MDDFWHVRVVPYATGAVEFAQNLLANMRDAVCVHPGDADNTSSFAGTVSCAATVKSTAAIGTPSADRLCVPVDAQTPYLY